MSETYVDTYLPKGWKTIDYADSSCGYEWDEVHVMRGPDGRLYVGSGSGCSCNSFGDGGPSSDWERAASWQKAADYIQEWIAEVPDERSEVGMNLIERLREVRPPAHVNVDPRTH